MTTRKEQANADALKASAYDVRRLADRNVPALRALGTDDANEIADELERLARNVEAVAQEHDSV